MDQNCAHTKNIYCNNKNTFFFRKVYYKKIYQFKRCTRKKKIIQTLFHMHIMCADETRIASPMTTLWTKSWDLQRCIGDSLIATPLAAKHTKSLPARQPDQRVSILQFHQHIRRLNDCRSFQRRLDIVDDGLKHRTLDVHRRMIVHDFARHHGLVIVQNHSGTTTGRRFRGAHPDAARRHVAESHEIVAIVDQTGGHSGSNHKIRLRFDDCGGLGVIWMILCKWQEDVLGK